MRNLKFLGVSFLLAITAATSGTAQNPIIQTKYTADPAPMVYNDTVFLYTTHDEDDAEGFKMLDWLLYTSTDMVNWTDHGAVASLKSFDWVKRDNGAWAEQVIERNGKFYMYCPIHGNGIGVLVSDSPYGPFKDPLNKPLVWQKEHWDDIDPTVFIDDDGQAYMYWGNPNVYYVKLNEDMISYKEDIVSVPMTVESFGKREGNPERATLYEEGPWLYKRNGLYYLLFAAGPIPEHLGYATSNSPTGPWKYGGVLMPAEGRSFTNHPGIIDFKGNTYLFYHNGALPGGSGFTRSVCVEELAINKDKSLPQLKMTNGVSKPLGTLNPYVKTEAETIAWSEGVKSGHDQRVGVFVTATTNGSYTKVRNVDFQKTTARSFIARVGTTHNGNVEMEIRLDKIDGPLVGTIKVPCTGGSDRWALIETHVTPITGIHDVFFVFKGRAASNIMYFDYWRFTK